MIILYYNKLKKADNNAIQDIYYLEATLPTQDQINNYMKKHNTGTIYLFFKNKKYETIIQEIKDNLSKLEDFIPLYDIYSENLYLISKFNVYNRVIYQSYRFPTSIFYEDLKKEIDNMPHNIQIDDILEQRKYKKKLLMVEFLKSFNLDILYQTYTKVYYLYSTEVGKNITVCKRPSFISHFTHINPYYTRTQVINMALNMGIKLEEDKYYDVEEVNKLCKIISSNDINSDILLNHQKYIIDNNKIGLIQYYTLQGSYFINKYLRNLVSYDYKNNILEQIIYQMRILIDKAPKFDKSYTLYRFIDQDTYLQHLNIGDIYTENGFTSSTRDPFYRADIYQFGFILLKINIPKDIDGIALCVETVSHFPDEQEIIFSPFSRFRLDKKNKDVEYYHTDDKFRSNIKILYEFTYIGKEETTLSVRELEYKSDNIVDFLKINKIETHTLSEKIRYFSKRYINPLYQFNTNIDDKLFTIIAEKYDSTGPYNKFYSVNNKDGFSFYTIYDNYILFMIELGTDPDTDKLYLHVNYYIKYSALDREKIIKNNSFIKFISSIAYYFDIDTVIIYSDYKMCDVFITDYNIKQINQRDFGDRIKVQNKDLQKHILNIVDTTKIKKYYGGSYCVDFIKYIKDGTKRYTNSEDNILAMEIQPKFSYTRLDILNNTMCDKILKKDDQDELYQIYNKIYLIDNKSKSIKDFIIWIANNKCYLMDALISKMSRYYKINNPFYYDYYILDPLTFLYNRNYIYFYKTSALDINSITLKDQKNIVQYNKYRLNMIRKKT